MEKMSVESYFRGFWSDEILDLAKKMNRKEIIRDIIKEAKEDKITLDEYDINEYLSSFLDANEEYDMTEYDC
jgi:hypothetical protein